MRKFFTLFFPLSAIGILGNAQPIFTDRFDYGANSNSIVGLGSSPWVQTGTSGTNPIQYDASGSLTFPGYPATGGKVNVVSTGGQDIVAPLPSAISSNSIYFSVVASFSSVQGVGDYFIHFTQAAGATNFYGRVFVRPSASTPGSIQFGLMKNSGGSTTYAEENFELNTTYCIVLKYTFVDGATNNDVADLYVFKAATGVSTSEPPTSLLQISANTDAPSIQAVSIRQGAAAAAPGGSIDNVIVATSWNDFTSVLPVNILSFTASKTKNSNLLTWSTNSELNSKAYDVERSDDGSTFRRIQTVQAKGSANYNSYQVEDIQAAAGTVYYRIRMIDKDGSYKYSRTLSLAPARSGRFSIYPNPLPGSNQLTINHNVTGGKASIGIYTTDGRQLLRHAVPANAVQTSLNIGELPAGTYRVVLDNNGNRQSELLIKQ